MIAQGLKLRSEWLSVTKSYGAIQLTNPILNNWLFNISGESDNTITISNTSIGTILITGISTGTITSSGTRTGKIIITGISDNTIDITSLSEGEVIQPIIGISSRTITSSGSRIGTITGDDSALVIRFLQRSGTGYFVSFTPHNTNTDNTVYEEEYILINNSSHVVPQVTKAHYVR